MNLLNDLKRKLKQQLTVYGAKAKWYLFNTTNTPVNGKNKPPPNIVFLIFSKSKIFMVVMLSGKDIRNIILHHPVKSLSQPVQNFYNGSCAVIEH